MTDLAIVVFVAVLVFAAARIPAIGDALGRALRRPPAPPEDRAAQRREDEPRARPPAAS